MNVANVGSLSLGQWSAVVQGWNEAHGGKRQAPSDEEFDQAMASAQ